MKTKSLINAIEKTGIKVETSFSWFTDLITGEKTRCRNEYWAKGSEYKIHWYDQEGSAICVQVQGINESNDSQRDYFPGFFAHTIKEVIRYLKEI